MKKERIDKLLFEKGLAESRAKAQALVMAGVVLVNEQKVSKPSEAFPADAPIRIKGDGETARFVGRGGLKLEKALREFNIDAENRICLDVGASTGGFTDCLLQNGARKVVAVDVGTNQLVWKIRSDPRVEARENVNARYLKPEDFAEKFDLIVMDVSFISVTKIFPALVSLLAEDGKMIVLVKPQFEVGRGEVGKGGIVREPEKHEKVVAEVNRSAASNGLRTVGVIDSPILGADGNKEFLALYEKITDAAPQPVSYKVASVMKDSSTEKKPKRPAREEFTEGADYYFENDLMVLTERFLLKRGYCCGNGCRHCPYPKSDSQ